MTISGMFIYGVSNLLRTYINDCFFADCLWKEKADKEKRVAAGLLFFCLTGVGYLVFQNPVVNILTNMAGLWVMAMVYEGGCKKKLILASLIYSLNMACDVVVIISFPDYGNGGSLVPQIQGSITVLLLAVCQILVRHFIYRRNPGEFLAPHWKILMMVPVISIGMLHYMVMTSLFERKAIMVQSAGLLVVNVIIFYLFHSLDSVYYENAENEIFRKQAKTYANELDVILQTQEQIRSLQHDMKHHLRELMALAKAGQSDEIISYLEELSLFVQNPEEFVYSGNKEIDGNLNHMIKKAHAELKDIEVKVNIPEGVKLNIHPFDLNIILENLMENAIEAAQKTEDKMLHLVIKQHKNLLLITIQNTYCGALKEETGNFLTIKEEPAAHGYGLKNVKRIVEKYNGVMDTHVTDTVFRVDIMLYIPDNCDEKANIG